MSQNKNVPVEAYEMGAAMFAPEAYAKYNAEKKAKETDAVKNKLESYAVLKRMIRNKNKRLQTLEASIGSTSSPGLSGMPGGGGDGTSTVERFAIKKDSLERSIKRMQREERELLDELEALIDHLTDPDELSVIEMHYIDGLKWWPVCAALFAEEEDYEEKADKYLKRTFRIHGSALQALARVYNGEEAQDEAQD